MTFSGTDTAEVDFKLNGISIQSHLNRSDMDLDDLVNTINGSGPASGVYASKHQLAGGGFGVLLHAPQGEDISISQTMVRTGTAGAVGTVGVQGMYDTGAGNMGSAGSAVSLTAGNSTSNRNTTVGGRVLMVSDAAFSLMHTAAGSSGGFAAYAANTIAACDKGPSLLDADVSTTYDSNMTIGLVDAVLTRISMYRASLGAVQNRLVSTGDFLASSHEAMSSSRSRLNDADFAEETSNLSRVQLVRQAGVAMLAQANAAPQRVLDLLR